MTIRSEVYKIVRDVLSDGEVHRLSEVRDALGKTIGLTSTQTASRLKYMVDHQQILNVERGYYKLNDNEVKPARVGASNKIKWSLCRVKEVVFSTSLNGFEALDVDDKDVAALKILKEITSMVDRALTLYGGGADE